MVGLAALMLAKAMGADKLIGVDVVDERLEVAQRLGLADHVLKAGPKNVEEIRSLTNGHGVERAFDASGSDKGRLTAIQAARKWSRIALVGEGGTLGLSPSPDMIHDQKLSGLGSNRGLRIARSCEFRPRRSAPRARRTSTILKISRPSQRNNEKTKSPSELIRACPVYCVHRSERPQYDVFCRRIFWIFPKAIANKDFPCIARKF